MEKESTVKIQQKAKELRQELLQLTTVHLDGLSKKLRHLSKKLKEGREHDSFVETNLHVWKKALDDLKANLTSPSTFSISRHDRDPLVQNVVVKSLETNELFERVSENRVRIEENGQIAVHDPSLNHTEIRGKNEYTSGSHEICLRIEQSADSRAFVGINSKSTPLQNNSYGVKSAYGWTNNYIWSNGKCHPNKSTSHVEMKTNDIINLIFHCDKRKISMIHERTNAIYELDVNIDHCPFPWQLHVNLNEANSCVRIMSA